MRYHKTKDGEWIEPCPQTGHLLGCCDCGLVHTVNFRIVKGKVQLQAFRNVKATSNRRRNKKYKGQKLNP